MAYSCPKDLDGFLPHLSKPDTKFRQQVGADLIAYLAEPSNSTICHDIGQLIDGLLPWLHSSNYKVSSNGIEVMTSLIDRLGHDFRPYLPTVLPVVVDRLGDSKDTVREKAQLLILKLLERNVLTPQLLLEKLTPCFTHKNAKIREEVLRCLVNTLNEHGAHSITLSKYIGPIAKLLSDPTVTVRETAFSTLVDIYKHVGDKLRIDVENRKLVPVARLPLLMARFDEVRDAGELLATASTRSYLVDADEVDQIAMPKPAVPFKSAGVLANATKRTISASSKSATSSGSGSVFEAPVSRAGSVRKASAASGAVDEETFAKSFEDVPVIQIFSVRQLNEQMKTIQDTISDSNNEWNKRVDALKRLRSLVIAGGKTHEEFYGNLRNLEIPLQGTFKDLRSQVVREACITTAYLSQVLGIKFDHCAECLLNGVINLIQNSAKVVATAGYITVKFILLNTHAPRLVPIITNNLNNSKSKDIRRSCCEFLELILTRWPTHPLEKYIALLQEALRKGIADADPEARLHSRKAFRGFKDHFPDQADALLQSLELNYRRALQGELCLSSSSSSNSLTPNLQPPRQYVAHSSQSNSGSTENLYSGGLQRVPSLPRSYRQRSGIPVLSRDNTKKGFRSNSAIDLQAAQRAKARAQYSAMARQKVACGTASLQGEVAQQARPRRSPEVASMQSPERIGRTRGRNQVSHSQPTSRSGSPSSRIPYLYNRGDHDSPRPRRLSSGIPHSTAGSRDTSRETSPTRGSSLSRLRGINDRPPLSPASRPVMAQKILQQSREAENALADAFFTPPDSGDYHRLQSPRKTMRSLDNHSDESETSSLCSEKSFDSYRRPSDSYSWSGSQQRLASRDLWEPCHDINEIISMCASTVWQERKDGLVSLRYYLNSGLTLQASELKVITEIFTRMFMDSHTKGLSVFLDTLNNLIKLYKNDLHDWLYVLLQRIFHKIGTDLLTSTYTKLLTTLDMVKKSFPVQLQLFCVYRFLIDATQTPNSKVKVAVLTYLTALCQICEPSQFIAKPPANQALSKIINYAQDVKSAEIRQAAKNCIVALWNCNTPLVTMMLSDLPKDQQDIASTIVHSHLRKSSTGSEPGSPHFVSTPKALSPTSVNARMDDFNQEEIYKSLRKTTAEIQNYSYETLGSKLDKNKDTTSQDSGISQMSLGNDIKNDVAIIEERMEELHIRPNYTTTSGSHAMPYSVNGIDNYTNGYGSITDIDDEDLIKNILESCVIDSPTPVTQKQQLLSQLATAINNGQTRAATLNFKKLLRVLLDNLNEPNPTTQILVLEVFIQIFKSEQMKQTWSDFVELITLRIINAHSSDKREVVKVAERTAVAMSIFPFDDVLNVLTPVIHTSGCPVLQGAIKMLTKFIEVHSKEVTDEHLSSIMPGLIKANDHEASSVRKSAVFCIVELHKAVGEERLASYIATLAGSKLKLVRLYINRANQGS